MAIEKIKIPDLGDALDVEVIEICVQPGDVVSKDDSIIVLESEKAAMEIPASVSGKVIDIKVNNGDTVNEGSIFLEIEAEDSPVEEVLEEKTEDIKETEKSVPAKKEEVAAPVRETHNNINYTGSIYAGPAVRKLAREFGINLNEVIPSGPRGRIIKEDLHDFVKQRLDSNNQDFVKNPVIDFAKWGEIKTEPLTKFQKTAAKNLQQSWRNIPHVTQHEEIDITEMEQFRSSLYDYYTGEKIKVTPLAFIAKALVRALKEFPNFNASIDVNSNKITYKKYFHIGFAVDTPHGLMVPKIRNVNEMSIQKIGEELKNTSKLCRELKIDKKEFFGGSMTISSLGGIGGTHFTPIINPPEVAILGVGKNFDRLVKENGKIVSRKILPISLSYDHRIIDGAEGARFCVYLGKCLGKDFAFKLAV